MSNWFENNPTKSVITYTLVVAGATWAASTFILQDNRLNFARSELESQKSLTEQYKSKDDLLQRDIDSLRAENAEYRNWLGQTKDAIPVIIPRITELKEKIASLEVARTRAAGSTTANVTQEASANVGRSFVDDVTGLVFTVKKTMPDQTAQVSIKLPDADAPIDATIDAGHQWRFTIKDTKYLLTVTDISFLGDRVGLRINIEQ